MRPLDILARGVESLAPFLDARGELLDPVAGQPFQYGTAYCAYCHAVLARMGRPERRSAHAEHAFKGLCASLDHIENPQAHPWCTQVYDPTASLGRHDHRDFFWPPVLRTFRALRDQGGIDLSGCRQRIEALDPEQCFASRPPSNWSAVWISGEWLRMRDGMSACPRDRFDRWVEDLLSVTLIEQGFYQEPGHPNSYDLFTRYHLAAILLEGYDGPAQAKLARLLVTGLDRSLAVQLSDGSLASAHRSTGQTWTLGAEAAFFTQAAAYLAESDPGRARAAQHAAQRAVRSLERWQPADGPFSPVENLLPSSHRVGYQDYTAVANYSALALAFLAQAVELGIDDFAASGPAIPASGCFIEHDPTFRALVHAGPYSVHVNAFPSVEYDAFGITDITFGEGRHLHFASSVRHVASGRLFNLGLAVRYLPGPSVPVVMAQERMMLTGPIQTGAEAGSLTVTARPNGRQYPYRIDVSAGGDGIAVRESTPGYVSLKSLFIPYLRDNGDGVVTEVETRPGEVVLQRRDERVVLTIDAKVDNVVHLTHGYENRRGLCGLIRLDFADPATEIAYRVARG